MIELDLEYLESITEGDIEFRNELIEIFKVQVVEYKEEFAVAMSEKNTDTLSRIAHKAKSSVVVMGLTKLAEELNSFEEEAGKGLYLDKYIEYVSRFESECDGALIQLDELV